MRRQVIMLIITVVAIVGSFVATVARSSRPVLGLDLQGGISIVLFPVKGSDLTTLNTAVASSATVSTASASRSPT